MSDTHTRTHTPQTTRGGVAEPRRSRAVQGKVSHEGVTAKLGVGGVPGRCVEEDARLPARSCAGCHWLLGKPRTKASPHG